MQSVEALREGTPLRLSGDGSKRARRDHKHQGPLSPSRPVRELFGGVDGAAPGAGPTQELL